MLDLHIEYRYVLDNLEVIKNPERICPKTEPHKAKPRININNNNEENSKSKYRNLIGFFYNSMITYRASSEYDLFHFLLQEDLVYKFP